MSDGHGVDEGRGLRVATFNVRAAIGPGPFPDRWWRRCDPARLARIARVILELDVDLIWPIDHLLVNGAWRVTDCAFVTAAGDASDHYPVLATLRR